MTDTRIEAWKKIFNRAYKDLLNDGVLLAKKTAEIIDVPDPRTPGLGSSERRNQLIIASDGQVSSSFIDYLAKIGRDKDPYNAIKVFLSGVPNARDWLKIPATQRVPILAATIPVLRYGAKSTEDHDAKVWDNLTVTEFKRAVNVVEGKLCPLDDQLARMGQRKEPGAKWNIQANGLKIPRHTDLSVNEVVQIVVEMSRAKMWTASQAREMIRAIEASVTSLPQ